MAGKDVDSDDDLHWFSKPAVLWDATFASHQQLLPHASSSYWDSAPSLGFTTSQPSTPTPQSIHVNHPDKNDRLCFMTFQDVLFLATGLAKELYQRIQTVLDSDYRLNKSSPSSSSAASSCGNYSHISVPVAVAIPEGPLLPLTIAAVHATNLPCMIHNNDNDKKSICCRFSVVLVPLEPTDGRDRLRHMLQDAEPAMVLTAANCDFETLQDIVLSLESVDATAAAPGSAISSQGLYRSKQTQIMDVRSLLQESLEAQQHKRGDARGTFDRTLGSLEFFTTTATLLDIFSVCLQDFAGIPVQHSTTLPSPNRISHIVYTSGTTGVPKGCISSITSLQNYIASKNQVHGINHQSIVLLASALSFDPCLSDILATLSAGATLVIAPRDCLRQILPTVLQTLQVTHCLCTPTLWGTTNNFVTGSGGNNQRINEFFPHLRVIALGGERISQPIVRTWARRRQKRQENEQSTTAKLDADDVNNCNSSACPCDDLPHLYSTFGVTEACVYQTFGEVFEMNNTDLPGQDVGLPFPGLGIRICDESNQTELQDVCSSCSDNKQPCLGEVVVFGNQLDEISGYLDRPELAHKFVHEGKQVCYRTGDRGYLDPVTKHLHILGRIHGEDGMIKINGMRVELGEIEAALLDREQDDSTVVVDAIVAVKAADGQEESSTVDGLIGHVVLSDQCLHEMNIHTQIPESGILCTSSPLLTLLRERCKVRARVTPSAFVVIPRIPLSPTGKRFRRGLPPLSNSTALSQILRDISGDVVSLRSCGKTAAIIAEQIVDVLNLQPHQESLLTTKATFAMLGGDSLAATRVTRALYALHNKVENTRFIGGEYGIIQGPFAVVHLLRASSLGAYVDWIDGHNPDWSMTEIVEERDTHISNEKCSTESLSTETILSSDASTLQEVEAALLHDALMQSVVESQTAVSIALLDIGSNPNFGNHGGRLGNTSGRNLRKKVFRTSPMHLACLKALPDVVDKLIQKGSLYKSPDASSLYPIHLAAAGEGGTAPYCEAEDNRRVKCVQLLLKAGVPLTMKDGNKQTIIHAAARGGFKNVLRYIMREWAQTVYQDPKRQDSMNWRDRWSRTPVHWAILNGKVGALEVLLDMGCSASPPTPKFNKSSNVALESPMVMAERIHGSSETGDRIKALLQKAFEIQTRTIAQLVSSVHKTELDMYHKSD